MSPMTTRLAARLLDGLDLLIDFATLGEYGLEELPPDEPGGERIGHATGWEALAPARGSSPRRSVPASCARRAPAGSLV
jgi:hypothetical protein